MEHDNKAVMAEIRNAILEEKKRGDRLPGEITVKEYAEEYEMSPGRARAELRKAVKLGVASVRPSKHNGNMKYYCLKEE